MNFAEYCRLFYIDRGKSFLSGKTSKNAIAEYILDLGAGEKHSQITVSIDAYRKYFSGERPVTEDVWRIIKSELNCGECATKLLQSFNDIYLNDAVAKMEITLGPSESIDKVKLSKALAKQLKYLADKNGETEHTIAELYAADDDLTFYPDYVKKAKDKYKNISILITDEDVDLESIYVCNSLYKPATFAVGGNRKEMNLDDPSLESIKGISDYTVLIGNGGSGKSMMLQHLILGSLKEHERTGAFPVLINLGKFDCKNGKIIDSIKQSILSVDPNFNFELLFDNLLPSGKIQLILDGYDEIDPGEVKYFQDELAAFRSNYSTIQIVMASRGCRALEGVRGYISLYIKSFDRDKCLLLIDKLCSEDEELNAAIKEYMDTNFFTKHTVFKTNPMLLTFIVMHYPIKDYFKGSQRKFYKKVYDTILFGHDEQKPGYDRIFRSVSNSDEFTSVFREFCALTFTSRISKLDENQLSDYFSRLESRKCLSDPGMLNEQTFIRDVCTTACMMYEERQDYYYIDQGFQEYLFAEYQFLNRNEQEVIDVGKAFWQVSSKQFESLDAFHMLRDMSLDKVEKLFFLPFLKTIFNRKTEDEKFVYLLRNGFNSLTMQYIDPEVISKFEERYQCKLKVSMAEPNMPSTVILSLLLQLLHIDETIQILLEKDMEFLKSNLYEVDTVEKYATFGGGKNSTALRVQAHSLQEIDMYPELVKGNIFEPEENVIAGYRYRIVVDEITKDIKGNSEMISLLKDESLPFGNMYDLLKGYYCRIEEKFREVSFE